MAEAGEDLAALADVHLRRRLAIGQELEADKQDADQQGDRRGLIARRPIPQRRNRIRILPIRKTAIPLPAALQLGLDALVETAHGEHGMADGRLGDAQLDDQAVPKARVDGPVEHRGRPVAVVVKGP